MAELGPEKGGADTVSTLVGENPAFLCLNQAGANHLVWVDGDSGVFFWISAALSGSDLIKIAESVERLKESPLLEERRLTWVPAGYWELNRIAMPDQYHVQYQNDEGYIITLSCCRGAEGASLGVIPTGDGELSPQPVLANGLPGELYLEDGEANMLVWAQDGLLFSILGCCSAEELLTMAENVEIAPFTARR